MEDKPTIFRIQKDKDNPYVMLDKRPLNQSNLSYKAKGIWAYLMSKPDNWTVNLVDIERRGTDGRDAVRSGIQELEDAGYIKKYTQRDPSGKFIKHIWLVFEQAQNAYNTIIDGAEDQPPYVAGTIYGLSGSGDNGGQPFTGYPEVGKPEVGKPEVGNPTLLNKDSTNKRFLTTKELTKGSPSKTQKRHSSTVTTYEKQVYDVLVNLFRDFMSRNPADFDRLVSPWFLVGTQSNYLIISTHDDLVEETKSRLSATCYNHLAPTGLTVDFIGYSQDVPEKETA